MATFLLPGWRWKPGTIDADGHRSWQIELLVQGDQDDGPATAVQTPGLPLPGDTYAFGNDIDIWAWCREGPTNITPFMEKGNLHWRLTYTYSTRPPDSSGPGGSGGKDNSGARKKCADQRIEDPLSEPPATSGSSIKYTREEEFDKDGKPFRYTSFEKILGAQREFDAHREQVVVEMNVLNLERGLMLSMMDKLNEAPMWDMPARCWKMQDWSWQRKLYGTCGFYYTRRMVFESNAIEIPATSNLFLSTRKIVEFIVTGPDGRHWLPLWDHYVLDDSSKVLNGHWHWINGSWILDNINGATPSATNPDHYIQAVDRQHNPIRVVLSQTNAGQPATGDDDANYILAQKFLEADLFELGIPVELD